MQAKAWGRRNNHTYSHSRFGRPSKSPTGRWVKRLLRSDLVTSSSAEDESEGQGIGTDGRIGGRF